MILHVDMDAFYASVEERENPSLIGTPVIVGGSAESRGVVSAANYAARKFGVHSAMATATARRLCPHGNFLPSRMELYAKVARQIREIFERYTPLVEPLSLDEAFLDVTGSEGLFGPSEIIGKRIKREIRAELQLVASVGVAPNKFIAKIASDVNKPDGFVVVSAAGIQAFLDPLPVERLWGVGAVSAKNLHQLGIRAIGDLRLWPLEVLSEKLGESGNHLWRLAHGLDDRRVVPDREAKSISHETTFAHDITDRELLEGWLVELVEQVARRLRRHQLLGRTVQLKIRFTDFTTLTRAQSLPMGTHLTKEIRELAKLLLQRELPERHRPVRLLGVGITNLEATQDRQGLLFDEEERQKQKRLDQVTDAIRDRFGNAAVRPAKSADRSGRRMPEE